jgi:hypothetical protein
VPAKGALDLAQSKRAIPFVIPGAELSRREGKVTFAVAAMDRNSPERFLQDDDFGRLISASPGKPGKGAAGHYSRVIHSKGPRAASGAPGVRAAL